MKFFGLATRISPRRDRRRAYNPESLEGRSLLSTVVAAPAAHVEAATHSTHMKGGGDGLISLAHVMEGRVTYTGTGHLVHLGRVTITGGHVTFPTDGNILKSDTIPVGALTITASNGDTLSLSYTGSGTLASTPQELGHTPPIIRFNDTLNCTIT
ncbi:MAG: hypothetical protein LC745_05400, partial [Planctomycetia bacterium]|nr:hypothetical protein [Planctomycetia bacterium]